MSLFEYDVPLLNDLSTFDTNTDDGADRYFDKNNDVIVSQDVDIPLEALRLSSPDKSGASSKIVDMIKTEEKKRKHSPAEERGVKYMSLQVIPKVPNVVKNNQTPFLKKRFPPVKDLSSCQLGVRFTCNSDSSTPYKTPSKTTFPGIPLTKNLTPFKPKATLVQPFEFDKRDQNRKEAQDENKQSTKKHHCSKENVLFEFKAKQPSILYRKPFLPHKAQVPLTETQNIVLNTEIRAEQRKKYNEQMKARYQEYQVNKAYREECQRKIDEEELRKFRQNIVHKAKPAPKFKHLTRN